MSCNVCCSNYNKSLHLEVKCYFPSCSFSACKECIRTYLTGTTADPHCMNCRNKWSLEFTKSSLNASFVENEYKNHRKTILADRAVSQIPEFYEGALRYGQLTESDIKLKEIMKEISDHRTIISQLYVDYDRVRREMDSKGASETRKFVMQCQNNGCRGMLTQHYKCDLCTKYTCPKCFLAIDGDKGDHVCKQDDMDTVEELRKNTRPCPACGLRISKIDGCDQMWCIECKTAFSWSKGTVEKGVVHNPHYYQWMRQNGGVPRNPNEHNEGCGNVFVNASRKINDIVSECLQSKKYYVKYCEYFANYPELLTHLKSEGKYEKYQAVYDKACIVIDETKEIQTQIRDFNKFFSGFHRYINHIEYTELRPLLNNIRTREQNRDTIYQYILNRINKDELAEELIKMDNLNMKERAHSDILEALVVVGKQIVIDCIKDLEATAKDFPFISDINSKFDNDTNLSQISFLQKFVKHYVLFLPQELERYQREIHSIFIKYKKAISKYCAYSNIESIKFLMTYGSKKTLVMWNYYNMCIDHCQFKTKGEMVLYIKEYQEFYNENSDPVENTFIGKETL